MLDRISLPSTVSEEQYTRFNFKQPIYIFITRWHCKVAGPCIPRKGLGVGVFKEGMWSKGFRSKGPRYSLQERVSGLPAEIVTNTLNRF